MPLKIAIPTFYLKSQVTWLSNILGRFKALFMPFAVMDSKFRMFDFGKLALRIGELVELEGRLSRQGLAVENLILHTEYMLPKWFDAKFIKGYVEAVKGLLTVLAATSNTRLIEVELHPGFSNERLGKEWNIIADGMASFLAEFYDNARSIGVAGRTTVECRGGSLKGVPQAVSTTIELLKFRELLEEKLREKHVYMDVGITVDLWQDVKTLKRQGLEYGHAVKIIRENTLKALEEHSKYIHDVHVHWHEHRVPSGEIFKEIFEPLLRAVKHSKGLHFITPEVTVFKREKLLQMLQEISQTMLA